MYRKRCQAEVLEAARTRFMTFTFRPRVHEAADREVLSSIEAELAQPSKHHGHYGLVRLRAMASVLRDPDEGPLEGSAFEDLFRRRASVLYKHVQAFMKRLRTNSGSKVRYCIVAEPHSEVLAGRPHFHMLLHEVEPSALVVKGDIRKAWDMRVGFLKHNVVKDENSRYIGYLTKYLTKTTIGRVVCSLRYGESAMTGPQDQNTISDHNEVVAGAKEGCGEIGMGPSTIIGAPQQRSVGNDPSPPTTSLGISLAETFDSEVRKERSGLTSTGEDRGILYERALVGAPSEWRAKLRDEMAFRDLMSQYGPDLDLSRRRRPKGTTLH